MSARTVPAPLTPAVVIAATRPRGFGSPSSWAAGTLAHHCWLLLEDSAERMEGTAYLLHATAINTERSRKTALYAVAAGLLDQAHVLRAAVAMLEAERDTRDAETDARADAASKRRAATRRAKATTPAKRSNAR